ncbi:MAG: hypothetical protein P9L92_20990 [Candidatus Electryonea clarkiae]|nr:hypothetical protein [Candidatus Electryonea clarkiae]MDP8285675.1 hypothetical protein [Candidatus Electryonea clarkiae]
MPFIFLLALSTFSRLNAQILDPFDIGRSLLAAEQVLLVQPVDNDASVTKYNVIKVLFGEKTDYINALPPPFECTSNDTLVMIVRKNLSQKVAQNKIRIKLNLPLLRFSEFEIFHPQNVPVDDFQKIIEHLAIPDTVIIDKLLNMSLSLKNKWLGEAAESILLTKLLIRWSEMDSCKASMEAVQLLSMPLSNLTHLTASKELSQWQCPEIRDQLETIINNISLEGIEVESQKRSWQIVNVYTSLLDSHVVSVLSAKIAREISEGNAVSPSIAMLYAEAVEKAAIEINHHLSTAITEKLQDSLIWSEYEFQGLLVLATTLPPQDAARCLELTAEIIKSGRLEITKGTESRISESLKELASNSGKDGIAALSIFLNDPELKRSNWTRNIILALAATNCSEAADSLIILYERKYYRRNVLAALAGMDVEKAWRFALNKAENDVERVLALGDKAEAKEMTRFTSGAAMNVLAARADDIPEIEELILRFYNHVSPALKDYAFGFLYKLPTMASARLLLPLIPLQSPDYFPTDLMVMKNMPSDTLALWFGEVLAGRVELPNMSKRQHSYTITAIHLLAQSTSPEADIILEKAAVDLYGQSSLTAFAYLLERGYVPEPGILAEIVFSPRENWDRRIIQTVFGSKNITDDNKKKAAKTGIKILKKNRKKYESIQLQLLARTLAESQNPDEFKSLLKLLRKSNDSITKSWASYGKKRIKQGF